MGQREFPSIIFESEKTGSVQVAVLFSAFVGYVLMFVWVHVYLYVGSCTCIYTQLCVCRDQHQLSSLITLFFDSLSLSLQDTDLTRLTDSLS